MRRRSRKARAAKLAELRLSENSAAMLAVQLQTVTNTEFGDVTLQEAGITSWRPSRGRGRGATGKDQSPGAFPVDLPGLHREGDATREHPQFAHTARNELGVLRAEVQ